MPERSSGTGKSVSRVTSKAKLVIYRDDAALKRQASAYPLLWNFHAAKREGEFDDGAGTSGHIDFRTVAEFEALAVAGYDAIELVGVVPGELVR